MKDRGYASKNSGLDGGAPFFRIFVDFLLHTIKTVLIKRVL